MRTDHEEYFETASATTNPDNENSGNFAYIICAITIVATIVLSLATAGFMNFILSVYWSNASQSQTMQDFSNLTNPYDFDELLNDYYTESDPFSQRDDSDAKKQSSSVSVDDALDFDLAPYLTSLNAEVPANAYANTPSTVRDYVRDLVTRDGDFTNQIARHLDSAAINTDRAQDEIAEAVRLCGEARTTFESLDLPAIENDEGGKVRDLLGTAKGEIGRRFDLMSSEIGLLATTDEVDTDRLWNYDSEVVQATEAAGDHLVEAMASATIG